MQAELLGSIGTVAKTVRPIIVSNRIRNVPEVLGAGHRPSGVRRGRRSWFTSAILGEWHHRGARVETDRDGGAGGG